jgi:hypothetical protein
MGTQAATTIAFSIGQAVRDTRPARREVAGFEAFVDFLDQHRAPSKATAGYFCGPMNGTGRRCAGGVVPRRWIALDFDRIAADTLPDLRLWLARFSGASWPTHSSKPEAPRLRVIVELDREADRAECAAIGEALAGDLAEEFGEALELDNSTLRGEQPIFLPPADAAIERLHGAPLAVGPYMAREATEHAPEHVVARDVGYLLPEICGADPLAMRAIARLDPNNRDTWIAVMHDLRSIERSTGATWPRNLWVAWSELSAKHQPGDDQKWGDAEVGTRSGGLGNLCLRAGLWHEFALSGFVVEADDPRAGGATTAPAAGAALRAVVSWQPPQGDLRISEPPQFAVDGLIQRGQAGLLIAEGATGKTSLLILRGICHATGRLFLGQHVVEGTFVLLSRDDSPDDLRHALADMLRGLAVTDEEIELVRARFRIIGLRGLGDGLLIEPEKNGRGFRPTAFANGLIAALGSINDLVGVAFDTARQFTGCDSSDEPAQLTLMLVAAAITQLPRRPYVEIVHHTGKAVARGRVEDMYSAIGSSALADNARYVLRLRALSDEEIGELHLPADFAIPIDGSILKLTSTRGSLRVKTLPPIVYAREGFRLERINGARERTGDERAKERRLLLLRRIVTTLKGGAETKTAIRTKLGGNYNETGRLIDELLASGLLVRTGALERAPIRVSEAGFDVARQGGADA